MRQNETKAGGASDPQREAILRDGFLVDPFLSNDPDVDVFGLNLACAWPFPEAWHAAYEQFELHLNTLGPEVYVYPKRATHITLVTFVSFAKQVQPSTETAFLLRGLSIDLAEILKPLFSPRAAEPIRKFQLEPQRLQLGRAAAFLPMTNSDGQVQRLRAEVVRRLQANEPLYRELMARGFNVPGIIHSTVMRFAKPPRDVAKFTAAFDIVAADNHFPPLEIDEVVQTFETKPYMRRGERHDEFRIY